MKFKQSNLRQILAAQALLTVAVSAQATYQHYRFEPTRLFAGGTTIQLSEFVFSNDGTRLNLIVNNPELTPAPTVGQNGTDVDLVPVTVRGGSRALTDNEGAFKLIDGLTSTKWLTGINENAGEARNYYFSFTQPVTVDAYNFANGADTVNFPDRRPVDWKVWGRNSDTEEWVLVDRIVNNPGVTANEAFQEGFEITGEVAPPVNFFSVSSFSAPIVKDGGTVELEWDTYDNDLLTFPESISISPAIGGGALQGSDFRTVTPPAGTDTVYTLTAANGAKSTSRSVTLRAVAGGTATHRYFRYTPVATRPASNGTQLSEVSFFFQGQELNLYPTNSPTPPVTGSTGTLDDVRYLAVTNPGGTQEANAGLLVDGLSDTKLFDGKLRPVIFTFEEPVTIDGYRFTTGNDFEARDPVRWTLEGSDDGTTWTLIDNVTAFDYPTTFNRLERTQVFPLPGTSLDPDVTPAPVSEWTGALNAGYDTGPNWSTGSVPSQISEVLISSGSPVRGGNLERTGKTTVTGSALLTVNGRMLNRGELIVSGGGIKQTGNYFITGINFRGTIDHSAGTVDSTVDRGFFISDDGPAAGSAYRLSGTGVLTVKSTGNGNTSLGGSLLHNVHFGKGGTGDLFAASGGTATFTSSNNNFVYLSRTSTLRVSGGAVTFGGYQAFLVGFEGAGDSLVEVSGGSLTLQGVPLLVGGGATGQVRLSGGTLTLDRPVSLGQSNANGTFTMTGGTLVASDLTSTARGTFTFEGGEILLTGDRRAVVSESWFAGVAGTTATYDATADRTRIAVTGVVDSAFDAWAIAAGLPEGMRDGDDDADNDGVSNLLEFALGGNPADGASTGTRGSVAAPGESGAVLTLAVRAGSSFAVTDGKLTAEVDGIRYEIEGTTDLTDWTAAVEEVVPAIAGSLVTPGPEWELRSFRLTGDAPAAGFLRAVVNELP